MKNSYIKKYETTNIFDDVDIFPVIKKNNDFKPLKIFISYGHPEREICRIICECLVRRGHKVWFDENNILPGNNWRASIVEGITDCDSFIAGLSKHYVKENSVCLDELSVAIGVKKGNIKTILLDSEKDVDPPSSVSCVQWLDMHNWMEQKENKKQFIDWLQKKLKQLIETIEAVPDRNFAGDIEQIRKKLCPVYTTTKQSYLLKQSYVERVWLNKIIESWLKDFESEKMCIVYGLPGSGKSIFAANYMHYNSRVAATIFCEADKPQFNSVNNIIRVLSYQLACRLPEYREMLKYIIKDIKINFLNEQELFDVLIAQPLCDNIDGNHDPMCILIDGLDECRNGDRNILSEVLQIYANRLPNWIKILILSRPESEIIGALGKSFFIDINKYKKENEGDIEKYVKNILNNNGIKLNKIESIIQKIVKKSEGIFLYAKVVLDELIKNKITLKELDGLQEGLNSIFFQWFSRMFQSNNEYEKYFVDAISIMLWEKTALPKDEIKIVLGWNNRKLNNFIQRMEVFLQEETDVFGKETIKFSHMYIREWLMTKYAGRFQCFAEDGLQSMKTAYLDLYFRKGCKALTEYEILHIQEILINTEEDVKTIVNDTDLFWQIMRLGFYCDNMLKIQDGLYCYEKALRLVQENNTVESVRNKVEAYINIGKSLQSLGDFKLAEKYWKEAIGICKRLDSQEVYILAICYASYGEFLNLTGRYIEAKEKFLHAVDFIKNELLKKVGVDQKRKYSDIYNSAAINLRDMGEYQNALKYFEKSKELLEDIKVLEEYDQNAIMIRNVNIAIIMQDLGEQETSMDTYNQYLQYEKRIGNKREVAHAYELIGNSYILEDKYEEANKMFEKSLHMRKKFYVEGQENLLSDEYEVFWCYASKTLLEYRKYKKIEEIDQAIVIGNQLCKTYFTAKSIEILLRLYIQKIDYLKGKENQKIILEQAIELSERVAKSGMGSVVYKFLDCFYFDMVAYLKENNGSFEDISEIMEKWLIVKNKNRGFYQVNEKDFNYLWEIMEVYITVIEFYYHNEQYLRAIELCKQAYSIVNQETVLDKQEKQYIDNVSYIYYCYGLCNEQIGKVMQAYDCYKKVIDMLEAQSIKDLYSTRRLYFSLNNIGRIYMTLKEYEKAIEMFGESIKCMESIRDMWKEEDKENYNIVCSNKSMVEQLSIQ